MPSTWNVTIAALDRVAFARGQMALSLGFHIIFAAIGIALPLLIFIAQGMYLRSGRPHYLQLARKWAQATGLVFAIGAVSGTTLAFELGLLWPKYMALLGGVVGQAFALEGFAFFVEAIFLGLYLYGFHHLHRVVHWLCAGIIALSGLASGALVLAVNAWMQLPVGFSRDAAGKVVTTDPSAIFRTDAWITMSIHSSLACYIAIPLITAGIYAAACLRGRSDAYCRSAMLISMTVAGIAGVLQPLSGDAIGRFVHRTQPTKLAAMEAQFPTMTHAPLHLGGIPDVQRRTIRGSIDIPGGLSLLATHDPAATIVGLNDVPVDLWPNVVLTHLAFDTMVVAGILIAGGSVLFWLVFWRRGNAVFASKRILAIILVICPLGVIALEAGWIVTEAGRQPWIIQGVMLTRDAVSPTGNMPAVFFGFTALYLLLGTTVIVLLRRLADPSHRTAGKSPHDNRPSMSPPEGSAQ